MSLEVSIDFFKEKFKVNPSLIEKNLSHQNLEKLISKSYLLWHYSKFNENELQYLHRIYEYDSTGILIYAKLLENEKNFSDAEKQYQVFILLLNSKKNLVDFILKTIKNN